MDNDFVNKYHAIAGRPFDECVDYEMEQILDDGSTFHVMYDETSPVALMCYNRHGGITALNFFFVSPKYRNKKDFTRIWEAVWRGNNYQPFVVGIRDKNTPARKFYERMGGVKIGRGEDPKNKGQMVNIYRFTDSYKWRQEAWL